jgi:hypothetical protein
MVRLFRHALLCLSICGCGHKEVIEMRLLAPDGQPPDPNPSAYFVCTPSASAPSYTCKSGQAFHQADRIVDIGAECPYGLAKVYAESDGGHVSRIQYLCAVAPVDHDLPPDSPAPPPTPVPTAAPVSGNP